MISRPIGGTLLGCSRSSWELSRVYARAGSNWRTHVDDHYQSWCRGQGPTGDICVLEAVCVPEITPWPPKEGTERISTIGRGSGLSSTNCFGYAQFPL